MFVQSRNIASMAPYLSRDHRSDKSSLIAEKSHSTLTCVTGSAASARLQGCTYGGRNVGWDEVPHIGKLRKVRG